MFYWPAYIYIVLLISPTMCTIFFLIYLFLFSTCFGHPCAHHQEKITISMRHWYLSLCVGGVRPAGSIQSAYQTPPIQSDKPQCRIDTAIFSWWWAHGCPKYVEKRNKFIKQDCAPSWTYYQEYLTTTFLLHHSWPHANPNPLSFVLFS